MLNDGLDHALLLEVGEALPREGAVDLHAVDEGRDGHKPVGLDILVELVGGGLVQDDGVLGLVLDLALGPRDIAYEYLRRGSRRRDGTGCRYIPLLLLLLSSSSGRLRSVRKCLSAIGEYSNTGGGIANLPFCLYVPLVDDLTLKVEGKVDKSMRDEGTAHHLPQGRRRASPRYNSAGWGSPPQRDWSDGCPPIFFAPHAKVEGFGFHNRRRNHHSGC